jgi:hypothetical protein
MKKWFLFNTFQCLFSASVRFLTAMNDFEVDHNIILALAQITSWTFLSEQIKRKLCVNNQKLAAVFIFWRRALLKMYWTPSLWSYSTSGLEQQDLKPLLKEHVIFASVITSNCSSLMIQLFSYFTTLITTSAHWWLKRTSKSTDESFIQFHDASTHSCKL